ncbi:MAG: hypothetical protein R2909_20265 [Gemmatimonadales bacterium]
MSHRPASLHQLLCLTALTTGCGGPADPIRIVQVAGAADTLYISARALAPALAGDGCDPAAAERTVWDGVAVGQAGRGAIAESGTAALVDLDQTALVFWDAEGRERGRVGRRGSGPGEFGQFVMVSAWPGDTIAIFENRTARITLFTEAGLAGLVSLGDLPALNAGGLFGRFADGTLLFAAGLDTQYPTDEALFRAPYFLARWRRAGILYDTVVAGLEGPSWHRIDWNGRIGVATALFHRVTWAGATADRVVAYDNASPTVRVLTLDGVVERVVRLELVDPPVSDVDRDTAYARLDRSTRTGPVWSASRLLPEERPAALWNGTDPDGFWLAIFPPLAEDRQVYLRFGVDGRPTHCFRPRPDTRPIALAGGRALVVAERDSLDLISMERAVPFPAAR